MGFAFGLFIDPSRPEPLLVATGLLMWVMAEHLPEEHTTLAGFFRLGGDLAHVFVFIAIVADMLSRHP